MNVAALARRSVCLMRCCSLTTVRCSQACQLFSLQCCPELCEINDCFVEYMRQSSSSTTFQGRVECDLDLPANCVMLEALLAVIDASQHQTMHRT